MRNLTVKATALVAGALLLAACGTNKTESNGSAAGGAGSCDTSKGTLVLGLVSPLTGELSALGKGIQNSADLAVKQANEKCAIKGYKIALQAEDDEKNPQKGAQAATKLSQDANLIGVVGPLNSSVGQSIQPILAQKSIVEVSPANTSDSLTKGDNPASPKRPYPTYFRTCTVDSLQGPYAADFLVSKQGKKKIAIVTDGLTYGEGLATAFAEKAQSLGATVVTRQKVGEKDTDFSSVIDTIKPQAPDAVYFGGQYPQAGPFSKQLKDKGLNIPVMGGDGIFDQKYIDLGGKEGDYATSVGAPTEELDSAKAFVDAYTAAGYKEAFAAYGAFSYDAANAIIGSVATALNGGDWSADKRADVLSAMAKYNGQGATGSISFDEFGDSTNKVLTVYSVSGGKWVSAQTGTYNG
ncbi:branched-chain amino acid ABC transporter substrate-binding protein [Actinokineospora bangkokensis]|uniref:Branched chain amino acid ABC transporter substrate-binding protein n=1 Tax=Actinokineospora bangkokensis TaxID=1193682 RepID=A0A1Q9LR16_9PSEU|nr:branched-chain amino acid ABC transporter substrate-binding protein [Actinokineospora bangkokensis]OLR94497.1 branched chain amino acid ABC transporter substrate-binding protein [Actinokineospora bangkokensis]